MHYDISYKNMTSAEKQAKALKDIQEYLGPKKFNKMNQQFKDAGKIDSGQFEFICMVGGIEGYPVEAWYTSLYGDKND